MWIVAAVKNISDSVNLMDMALTPVTRGLLKSSASHVSLQPLYIAFAYLGTVHSNCFEKNSSYC